MAKKYELLREVLNFSTGHVIPVGEVFYRDEDSNKYRSKSGWWMSKEAILNPTWFEEVVEKEFVWDDKLVAELLSGCCPFSSAYYSNHIEKFKKSKSSSIPSGKGTANDVLNTDFINSSLASQEKFLNKLAEDSILSGSPLNTEKEWEIVEIIEDAFTKKISDVVRHSLEVRVKEGHAKIKSVKRLSDNEVFSVGEVIDHKVTDKVWGPIKKFDIIGKDMMVHGDGFQILLQSCKKRPQPTPSQPQDKTENYYNDLRDGDKWRKKERMEVIVKPFENYAEGKFLGYYVVEPTKPIQPEKLSLIKEAIEKIINNE